MPKILAFARWCIGLCFAVVWIATAQDLPDPKTVVEEVLANHPSVRKTEHLLAAALAVQSGSTLPPNPTLTLAATLGDPSENSNSLSQVFEISGQPRLRRSQAEAEVAALEQQLLSVRRSLASLVLSNWLSLWEHQHLAKLSKLRLGLVQDMVRVSQRRFEVGEIPQNESLRVELAAAEAQAEWKGAEAGFRGAELSLEILRGRIPAEAPIPLSDLETNPESLSRFFSGPDLDLETTDWNLEQVLASVHDHPDVIAMRQEQKALLYSAELVGKERAPQLGLSVYRSQFFGSPIEQGAQVSLSWPIFDWGRIDSQKRAQLFKAQALDAAISEKILEQQRLLADIWNAWLGAKSVREILASQAARYEELAREARIGYDLGLLSLTDVLQTESAFRQAGVDLIKAQAQVVRLELSLLEKTNLNWPKGLLERK